MDIMFLASKDSQYIYYTNNCTNSYQLDYQFYKDGSLAYFHTRTKVYNLKKYIQFCNFLELLFRQCLRYFSKNKFFLLCHFNMVL